MIFLLKNMIPVDDFPIKKHDSSEGEQWGRDEIYPDIWSHQALIIDLPRISQQKPKGT